MGGRKQGRWKEGVVTWGVAAATPFQPSRANRAGLSTMRPPVQMPCVGEREREYVCVSESLQVEDKITPINTSEEPESRWHSLAPRTCQVDTSPRKAVKSEGEGSSILM